MTATSMPIRPTRCSAATSSTHLEMQLVAAQRLLQVVLEQGAAIRRRDVQNVVRLAGMLQVEIQRRQADRRQRARLLERAGARLGVAPER